MPGDVLIDQFLLTVTAPRGLPGAAYVAIRQALDARRFAADLRRVVRTVLRGHPGLRRARVAVSR